MHRGRLITVFSARNYFNRISNDWTDDERDRAIDEMNTAGTTFCAAYDALVRVARRKLVLPPSGN